MYKMKTWTIVTLILFVVYSDICATQQAIVSWSRDSATLPISISQSFGGYDATTNRIWIFGGTPDRQFIAYYDLNSRSVTVPDLGASYVFGCSPSGSNTVNIGNSLYFISTGSNCVSSAFNLSTFNMETQTVNLAFATIPRPELSSSGSPCLTTNTAQDTIYATCWSYQLDFWMFSMVTGTWTEGPLEARVASNRFCACAMVDDQLYLWGGDLDYGYVRKIDVNNLVAGWSIVGSMDFRWWGSVGVIVHPLIYSVGGYRPSVGLSRNVSTIDTTDDSINTASRLPSDLPAGYTLAIFSSNFDQRIYTLGGFSYAVPTSIPSNEIWYSNPLPTSSPSPAPTAAPSDAPTYAPSNSPSNAPSDAPSYSPTACVDYNSSYNSSDGIDRWSSITQHNFSDFQNQTVDFYAATSEESLYAEYIHCNQTDNAVACVIACHYSGSCGQAHIEPATTGTSALHTLFVLCEQRGSCDELKITIQDVDIANMTVLCLDRYACKDGNITVRAQSAININIECDARWSCRNLLVNMQNADKEGSAANFEIAANLTCFGDYSCNNLFVHTDDSRNIFINLNMYRFSENIFVHHRYWRQVAVECGKPGEVQYIRYESDVLPNRDDLLLLARQEYPSTNRLPCDEITIECVNNTDFYQSCQYEYEILPYIDLQAILSNAERRGSCYWVDTGNLYQPLCNGNCGDPAIYHEFDVSFDLDLIFEIKEDEQEENEDEDEQAVDFNTTESANFNTTKHTKSYLKCEEYFGDANSTETSLNIIDAIFFDALSLISGEPGDTIRDIVNSPQTELRAGALYVECKNEEANTIKISTTLTVRSKETSQRKIDEIFDIDGKFMNTSRHLISLAFGVPLKFEFEQDFFFDIIDLNWPLILAIALVSALVIGGIVYYFWWKRYRQTIWISNPMVIMIGIGFYWKRRQCPQNEVEGALRDLDEPVRKDVETVRTSYGQRLNYTVHPKCYEQQKQGTYKADWNKDELIDFLRQKADELANSVHDSLMVFLSCHGIEHDIITSDRRLISKTYIHRLFSFNPKLRNIPRLFFYDCCSGDRERVSVTRERYLSMEDANDDSDDGDGGNTTTDTKKTTTTIGTTLKGEEEEEKETKEEVDRMEMLKRTETAVWARNEKNPDYKLAMIEGANHGFQSKADLKKGSYLITNITAKLMENVFERRNEKFLNEICDEVQDKLHGKDHVQLMTIRFFNRVGYIKLKPNVIEKSDAEVAVRDEVQLAEVVETKVVKPKHSNRTKKAEQTEKTAKKKRDL